MPKLHRIAASAGFVGLALTLSAGVWALPTPAGAAPLRGPARLIDTNRIVGFPVQNIAVASDQSRPGVPSARRGQSAPAITAQPTSTSVVAGSTASFSAAASGLPTPSVQWQVSTNGTSFSSISGATATTYSFSASATQSGDSFRAVFSNRFGSATTSAAKLTVTSAAPAAPAIVSDPSNTSVASGATASFSASASGSPAPTVQWSVSTNGGGSFTNITGATSTTYSFAAATSQSGNEYEATFTNGSGTATTTAATLTVTAALLQSSNWSGYADTGATFNAVKATWTVPTATCSGRSATYSAQWIGIDGYSSSTVEQDGSEVDCLSGAPSYDAWYEMYGDSAVNSGNEVEISPSTNPVSPGDVIAASVSVSGTTWTLALTDTSSAHAGWTFSTTVSYSGAAKSSAEWIVERPEVCSFSCSLTTLTNFGVVNMSSASSTTTASTGPISANADAAMEMVNGSTVLAVPSALTAGGAGFSDTWEAG